MIPLRDQIPSRRLPIMTLILILINLGIYFYQLDLSTQEYQTLIQNYAFIPLKFNLLVPGRQWYPLISHLFLHANFWHLLGNIWALWIFGDNVEDRMGAFRFLLFYLMMGIIGAIVHFWLNYGSEIPTLGASGAVAGVMGAYFIMYPSSRILTLVPLFGLVPLFIKIPAIIYLGVWFLMQISGIAYDTGEISNIAWGAHVGGFIAGVCLHQLFCLRKIFNRYHRL